MNPTVDERIIAEAYEADEASAAAEYGAEFRRDIESFIPREAVEARVVPGRHELPRRWDAYYVGFVDPSGGSGDSMTLAIAHREADGTAVIDAVREVRPPFSPDSVVQNFSALLREYGIRQVMGDRYAGEWPRERFAAHGTTYQPCEKPKSELYALLLPVLNSRKVALLDDARVIGQLCALERRTAWAGRFNRPRPRWARRCGERRRWRGGGSHPPGQWAVRVVSVALRGAPPRGARAGVTRRLRRCARSSRHDSDAR